MDMEICFKLNRSEITEIGQSNHYEDDAGGVRYWCTKSDADAGRVHTHTRMLILFFEFQKNELRLSCCHMTVIRLVYDSQRI